MVNKRPPDPRGGHVRIYWDVLDSNAWRALDWSAQALYVAMRRKLLSTNNGNIEATIGTLRHFGFKSSATLSKCLRSLQAVGLIAKTRQGGIAYGQKVCSLFRFTDVDTYAHPKLDIDAIKAGNEWRHFATLVDARKALARAHANARTGVKGASRNRSCLQKVNRTDTDSELTGPIPGSDSEQGRASLFQILNKQMPRKKAVSPCKD